VTAEASRSGACESHRGIDDAGHTVSLHEVSPLLACFRINVLSEQPVLVAAGKNMLEQFARFIVVADCGERIDVPEGADEKRVLRPAEVVSINVTVNEIAAS